MFEDLNHEEGIACSTRRQPFDVCRVEHRGQLRDLLDSEPIPSDLQPIW